MITVLVVEDNPNQRMLYQMELEEEGYRVLLASDGLEALRRMEEGHPDLVVLDLRMRDMDGVETLCRMRDLDTRLPVIIYSAYELFKDDFMTWGVDAYLVKSSNLNLLKAEIHRVLSERKREWGGPTRPEVLDEGIGRGMGDGGLTQTESCASR